jgi:hypothetical protein
MAQLKNSRARTSPSPGPALPGPAKVQLIKLPITDGILGAACDDNNIPSGKHTKSYGRWPFLMGKLSISMVISNSKLLNYQRVLTLEVVCPHWKNAQIMHNNPLATKSLQLWLCPKKVAMFHQKPYLKHTWRLIHHVCLWTSPRKKKPGVRRSHRGLVSRGLDLWFALPVLQQYVIMTSWTFLVIIQSVKKNVRFNLIWA